MIEIFSSSKTKFTQITLGILAALFLSVFIYEEHFFNTWRHPLFSSFFAILGFFMLLQLSRLSAFVCGSSIGILWFYWIGLSFRFYDLTYLIPLVWIFVALIFGIFFLALCYFKTPIYRISVLLCASFIHPFGFNWFIPELTLTQSYFFPSKSILALLLILLVIFSFLIQKQFYKISFLWLILGLFSIGIFSQTLYPTPKESPLKVKTISTNIPQNLRWDSSNLKQIIDENFSLIQQAKQEKYDLVILPETAFPIALNAEDSLLKILQDLSQDLTILVGAIHKQGNSYYNSAYLFNQGEMQIFDKIILVPFGEKIPLPQFFVDLINQIFFKGGMDFTTNSNQKPNSTILQNQHFQIAICYEATRQEFYQDSPSFLIAISNNAWFKPSIEPTLQKLLMRYFSLNYGTTIYHSSNGSQDFILSP
ncbi:apolipoprotein N-acyltransferase [Helicobacter colisuis]|uniref:apolipoprotein N-acyltransferase n=1 Tax=Helicobacter colisuis TaxID=2949739 RepID=UPI00202A3F51|nr:apolipoprotein N-acyltransferase [Helicobacter colisuis]MCL9822121.1 apolipoprotein N-acyltransferase [Helicobacter colisuis]